MLIETLGAARDMGRLNQILGVFIRHGFGDSVRRLGLRRPAGTRRSGRGARGGGLCLCGTPWRSPSAYPQKNHLRGGGWIGKAGFQDDLRRRDRMFSASRPPSVSAIVPGSGTPLGGGGGGEIPGAKVDPP